MGHSNPMNVLNLVEQALDQPSEEQVLFLEQALGDDTSMKASAMAILELCIESNQSLEAFLENPVPAFLPELFARIEASIPQEIGPYQILGKLGEGGMGTVFLAWQKHPVKRKVALKVIKQGILSPSTHSRFANECQVLALLNHPNVATIYEGGQIGEQPYFTMEYFPGMTIDAFVDKYELGLNEWLDAFLQACRGVAHAHLHGVIHRDLKPGNIMVKREGGLAVKLIDFGIAKALGGFDVTHHTMAWRGMDETMGPEHPETLASRENLALLLVQTARYREAEAILRDVLAHRQNILGKRHLNTLRTYNSLGMALFHQKEFPEATVMCQFAYDGLMETRGAGHRDTRDSATNLAIIYRNQNRLMDAKALYDRLIPGLADSLGSHHRST